MKKYGTLFNANEKVGENAIEFTYVSATDAGMFSSIHLRSSSYNCKFYAAILFEK